MTYWVEWQRAKFAESRCAGLNFGSIGMWIEDVWLEIYMKLCRVVDSQFL